MFAKLTRTSLLVALGRLELAAAVTMPLRAPQIGGEEGTVPLRHLVQQWLSDSHGKRWTAVSQGPHLCELPVSFLWSAFPCVPSLHLELLATSFVP